MRTWHHDHPHLRQAGALLKIRLGNPTQFGKRQNSVISRSRNPRNAQLTTDSVLYTGNTTSGVVFLVPVSCFQTRFSQDRILKMHAPKGAQACRVLNVPRAIDGGERGAPMADLLISISDRNQTQTLVPRSSESKLYETGRNTLRWLEASC